MDRILLIGNGLNLVSDRGASWNALLNHLAGTAQTQHEEDVRKEKPFTLWFEQLNSTPSDKSLNTPSDKSLKEIVADTLMNGLSPNKHHIDIMALDFKHVLTTNYDYCLEKATGTEWKLNKPAPESYHSLFRRHSSGERHLWHIHGELGSSSSIMLGHEQYSRYIHKIRNFLTTGVATSVKERKGRPYLSRFASKKIEIKGEIENWVDLFLEHEVHIVGFSFDYTENHLWNLLMEKQRLKSKGNSVGKIVFHRCSDTKQSIADEAKLSILSALGVKVIDHSSNTYSNAYDKCIKTLRLEMGNHPV